MKKLFVLLIAFILVISASGCGIKKKIGNKIGEKILESVTDTKVDVKGDEVTFKGEDGSQLSLGGGEWPESELLKDVPKFDKGTIDSVVDMGASVMIMVNDVKQKDYESYRDELKKDFTENVLNMDMDDVTAFSGGNSKGIYVQISYNISNSQFTITASKSAQ